MPRIRRPLLALVALVAALAVGYGFQAVDDGPPPAATSSLPVASSCGSDELMTVSVVKLSMLPPEARRTIDLIKAGGPFPYPDKDGDVFHNLEGELPPAPDGCYREYTVPTPGEDDRGARRLIVSRDGTYWYTRNHYASFFVVDLDR